MEGDYEGDPGDVPVVSHKPVLDEAAVSHPFSCK